MPIAKAEVYATAPVVPIEEQLGVTESERAQFYPHIPPAAMDSQLEHATCTVTNTPSFRRNKILDYLHDIPSSIPSGTKTQVADILTKYSDVVALDGDALGKTDLIRHKIDIPPDAPPIYIPAYRVAHTQKPMMEQEVQKMLKDGTIEPSRSPWSFPLLLVPKKDKTHRLVVDFRKLNSIT